MRRFQRVWASHSSIFLAVALSVLAVGLSGERALAGEIESLLQQGLPLSVDPTAGVQSARQSAYPLKPVDRLPFYGLPHDFVDTRTGRLAFKIEDLVLPGRMPIVMSRVYDSGGDVDIPQPIGLEDRQGADLGHFWSLAYSDYIQPAAEGFTLVPADGGPINFVPSSPGSSEYVKTTQFPSNHVRLFLVDPGVFEETRADGTVWRYVQTTQGGYFLLDQIRDTHDNFIALNYYGESATLIENSSGSWVMLTRQGLTPEPGCPTCPLLDVGCRNAQEVCYTPPPISRVVGLTDSTGRTLSFQYDDPYLQLQSWTDARGKTWQLQTTLVGGRVGVLSDPEGRDILSASYGSKGKVEWFAVGANVSTLAYTIGGTVTTVTDAQAHEWTYTHNADGITTSVGDPLGNVSSITLDTDNNVSVFTDPRGNAWQFTYTSGGHQPLTVTSPASTTEAPVTWTYAYDSNEHLEAITNPRGYTTRLIRNSQGDIEVEHEDFDGDGVIDANEPVWQATYGNSGELLTVTNPRGHVYSFDYDSSGLIDNVDLPCSSAACPAVLMTRDARGNVTELGRPTGTGSVTWSYTYDAQGHLLTATDPTNWTRSYEYDDAGLLIHVSDPLQGTQNYTYSAGYRLLSFQNGFGVTTNFGYDATDNLLTVENGLGQITTFTYNASNRLASRADPLGRQWNYDFDAAGNITSVSFPNGHSLEMSYDPAGRLASRNYPDGTAETYSRDLNGNVTSVVRTHGQATDSVSLTYDPRDLVASLSTVFPESHGVQRTMGAGFQYDLNGNRTTTHFDQHSPYSSTYTYDELDHVSTIAYGTGETYTYENDPWTLRRKRLPTRGNPDAVEYKYDDAGRVTGYVLDQGKGASDGTYHLSYDPTTGRLLSAR